MTTTSLAIIKPLSGYKASVAKACGVTDRAMIDRIETTMRQDVIHGTLDWLSARQFTIAARAAKQLIDYMDSPEGAAEYQRLLAA